MKTLSYLSPEEQAKHAARQAISFMCVPLSRNSVGNRPSVNLVAARSSRPAWIVLHLGLLAGWCRYTKPPGMDAVEKAATAKVGPAVGHEFSGP